MKRNLEIIEKICIVGIVILAVIIFVGIGYLWTDHEGVSTETGVESGTEDRTQQESGSENPKEELSGVLEFMPSNIHLGEKIELDYFQDAQGNLVDLQNEYKGKVKVLVFWGSWCSYCERTLQSIRDCSEILKNYPDVEIILINKTDFDKGESMEKAQSYLEEQKLDFSCFYDMELAGYQSFGIKRIPTLLVLDKDGYVRDITVDTVESKEEWEQFLNLAQYGKGYETFQKIKSKWMGEEGQVYTEMKSRKSSHPSGHDVLSESMGIMLEYAVLQKDKELFNQTELYLQQKQERDHIYSWYVTEDGKQADANALLDDFRIYNSFSQANDLWGEKEEELALLSDGILKHNSKKGELYSFYDFFQKTPGKEISLNYVDFQTLGLLEKQNEAFSPINNKMKQIVEEGYISDSFPLYYVSYNYKKGTYSLDDLHTAEALLTLYHLAQVENMKETSREWLRDQLSGNGLYAKYGIDGNVVPGYEYESAAVYAIAAMIGIEENDSDIYTKAILRMELLMQQNTDAENMRVFDLLMPMMAYARGDMVQFR